MSAAVDEVVTRSGRPDRRADGISFIRQTIRELQTVEGKVFDADIVEDQITANADPYVYTPDNLTLYRMMRSVQYPGLITQQGNPVYADYVPIGKKQNEHEYFYYKSGESYVFVGHFASAAATQFINIASYQYARILPYYALTAGVRTNAPAVFNLEDNAWDYHADYAATEALQEDARELVSNWLLEKWYDTIVEGGLAKLFKTVDDERARSSFALYSSYKTTMNKAEPGTAYGAGI